MDVDGKEHRIEAAIERAPHLGGIGHIGSPWFNGILRRLGTPRNGAHMLAAASQAIDDLAVNAAAGADHCMA